MWWESVCVIAFFILLALIGLGPALCLLSLDSSKLRIALCLAPTLGFSLVSLLGFPLVRYVGTVEHWAVALAVFLVSASLSLTWIWWQKKNRIIVSAKSLLCCGFICGCLLSILAFHVKAAGIQGAIFRANPSDAFVYMTLSEAVRRTKWNILTAGGDFHNRKAVQKLAKECPPALYSARFLRIPVRVSMMATLAFGATLFQVETQRFYYVFSLTCLTLVAPIVFLWCRLLNLNLPVSVLCSCTSVFGFWPRMNLELDSVAMMSSVPVVLSLLLLVALIRLKHLDKRVILSSAIFTAALCCLYFEIISVMAIIVALYLSCMLLKRKPLKIILLTLTAIGLAAVALLAVTGQLDYLIANQIGIWKLASENSSTWTHALADLLKTNPVSALSGWFAWNVFFKVFRINTQMPELSTILAYATCALCAIGMTLAICRSCFKMEVMTICAALGSLSIGIGFLVLQRWYFAMKGFLLFSAVLPVIIAFSVVYLTRKVPTFRRSKITAVILQFPLFGWAAGQFAYGAAALYFDQRQDLRVAAQCMKVTPKKDDFELKKITRYLENNKPKDLLLFTPEHGDIAFPLYCEFVFQKYHPYYQYGLIFDNEPATEEYQFQLLARVPEYVVISSRDDYVGEQSLGQEILRTPSLVLYKITSNDLAAFQANTPKRIRTHKSKNGPEDLFDTSDLDSTL